MPLDLTKKSPRRLGRGRVPREVRDRMKRAETSPLDRGLQESRHALSGRLTKDSVREMLNHVGGRWESPRSWQPRDPQRQRELQEHRGVQ